MFMTPGDNVEGISYLYRISIISVNYSFMDRFNEIALVIPIKKSVDFMVKYLAYQFTCSYFYGLLRVEHI